MAWKEEGIVCLSTTYGLQNMTTLTILTLLVSYIFQFIRIRFVLSRYRPNHSFTSFYLKRRAKTSIRFTICPLQDRGRRKIEHHQLCRASIVPRAVIYHGPDTTEYYHLLAI